MIEITNLHKSYKIGKNSLHVLKGINLHVKKGELVAGIEGNIEYSGRN